MYLIEQISSAPYQKRDLVLLDGSVVTMTIYFQPMQQCWLITELVYGDVVIRGMRITNQPNMLRQWKNLLPFGLGCYTDGNREPSLQEDFLSGASRLYMLSEAEVLEYEEYLLSD
jgi:hypothetical protein